MSEPGLLPLVGSTELEAPSRPVTVQPGRQPGSVRRTSHVDMTWPDGPAGDPEGLLVLDAGARDVVTGPDGAGSVAGEVRLVTTVLPGRRVTDIVAAPASVEVSDPVGLRAARR